ncbi:MAG: signal peptide peptidase SppA [Anaerolineae bacterium]|nr:signal peptide peptidase SppA [Thermoflexales bacterium]MDW8406706.1 signal peptide peptidase SppA [Anaerolineae bacterium]
MEPSVSVQAQPKNRTAAWTLAGVIIGFAMPVCACLAMIIAVFTGLAGLTGPARTTTSTMPLGGGPVHVSGPTTGPAVAIIDVVGGIVSGDDSTPLSTDTVAASSRIVPLIRQAAKDNDVKAIVLRINSPGGAVVPTNEIYMALKEADKPIVAVFGATAASGGYYIAMAAQHIVANPDTFTGSIGVILSLQDLEGLFEKVGVRVNAIKSGPYKDIGSAARGLTDAERALLQAIVDETYDSFVKVVAEGRKMSEAEVRQIADGRIMTGRQALQAKLVDQLGSLDDGIEKAAELGGITGEPRVIRYRSTSPFTSFLGGLSREVIFTLLGLPADRPAYAAPQLEYRWP